MFLATFYSQMSPRFDSNLNDHLSLYLKSFSFNCFSLTFLPIVISPFMLSPYILNFSVHDTYLTLSSPLKCNFHEGKSMFKINKWIKDINSQHCFSV